MAISDEISRIKTAAESIRSTLVAWGIGLTTDKIGDSATRLSGVTAYSKASGSLGPDSTSVSVPKGYYMADGSISVAAEPATVTITSTDTVEVTNDDGFLTKVTVNVGGDMINAAGMVDKTMCATAAEIVAGDEAIVWSSTEENWVSVTGTMTKRNNWSSTIDGLATTSVTIPAGYHLGGGTVSLTSDIETALAAI